MCNPVLQAWASVPILDLHLDSASVGLVTLGNLPALSVLDCDCLFMPFLWSGRQSTSLGGGGNVGHVGVGTGAGRGASWRQAWG